MSREWKWEKSSEWKQFFWMIEFLLNKDKNEIEKKMKNKEQTELNKLVGLVNWKSSDGIFRNNDDEFLEGVCDMFDFWEIFL